VCLQIAGLVRCNAAFIHLEVKAKGLVCLFILEAL